MTLAVYEEIDALRSVSRGLSLDEHDVLGVTRDRKHLASGATGLTWTFLIQGNFVVAVGTKSTKVKRFGVAKFNPCDDGFNLAAGRKLALHRAITEPPTKKEIQSGVRW
jgi:hypothetical protein